MKEKSSFDLSFWSWKLRIDLEVALEIIRLNKSRDVSKTFC